MGKETIEESIKQVRPFRSSGERTLVNLTYTYSVMQGAIQEQLKPVGITPQQYNILRILRGQSGKPCSQLDVRNRMLERQSDVSRLVERLLTKGLVERAVCPSDRRRVDLMISQEGLKVLEVADVLIANINECFASFSNEEFEQVNEFLDTLRDRLPKECPNAGASDACPD